MNNFLNANESKKLVAKVSGKRKREVGLVAQAKVTASESQIKINTFINQDIFLDVLYTLEEITVTTLWHKKIICRPCKRIGLTELYSLNGSLYKHESR